MSTLKDRVLIVLRGAEQPLSAPQIARILGLQPQRISSPLSRLFVYGKIERVAQEKDPGNRWRGLYQIKHGATA